MFFSSKTGEGGLLGLLRKLALQLVSLLETRAELLSVEFREEKIRLIRLMIWTCVALFLAAIGLVMLTMTVLFCVWDNEEYRLWALGTFTLLYLGGSAFGVYQMRKLLVDGELPFAETLNQLKKDRETLQTQREL
ncbi:MAG: hypothetical protein HC904_14770 [Blastochloris sp.]|nr:hypothetical protein [Blastochloris sp.]